MSNIVLIHSSEGGVDIKNCCISLRLQDILREWERPRDELDKFLLAFMEEFGVQRVYEGIHLADAWRWSKKTGWCDWLKIRYDIDESKKFCCKEFREHYEKQSGYLYFMHDRFHGWLLQTNSLDRHCLLFVKFCPFCGENLSQPHENVER